MKRTSHLALILTLGLAGNVTLAEDPLTGISSAARAERTFQGFSAERGAALFSKRNKDWSCSTCHGADPRQAGRHKVTGKPIEPMAPAINPRRLTDPAKVEKWFKRNCNDVFDRSCTAQEKGDVITYLRGLAR